MPIDEKILKEWLKKKPKKGERLKIEPDRGVETVVESKEKIVEKL